MVSCSNENATYISNNEVSKVDESQLLPEETGKKGSRGFTCHSFNMGINWPFDFSTTLHYCCVGDSLCTPGPTMNYFCSFVSDSTFKDLQDLGALEFGDGIHITELLSGFLPPSEPYPEFIRVEYSSIEIINGVEYKISTKQYEVDEDGYVHLELSRV